ncbi:hypothetical protein [Streptomyces sp. NPDC005301]|uniref:hypothetical protein n=1 Tax=Streptomyces sp. NPDC005301 TaxID=3156874 RepID=UPI0033A7697A
MTALTTADAPVSARPAAGRPGTVRAVLRLHRAALYAWAAVITAASALMLWAYAALAGPASDAYRRLRACDYSCAYDQDAYLAFKDASTYAHWTVTFLPLLVAAWAGAVLTARELESGTARLAWTQSVTPARWLAAKLAVPAALVTAGTVPLVVLHHLMWDAGRGGNNLAWHDILVFQANGPTTVALALFALAAGALAGLLLRRTLAALAVTAAATGLLWYALNGYRAWFWPPVTRTTSLQEGPWYGGLTTDRGIVDAAGTQLPMPHCVASWDHARACADTFERLHVTAFYSDVQPASHYWPLQLSATGAALALTALTVLAAFRVLKRHTDGTGNTGRVTGGAARVTGGTTGVTAATKTAPARTFTVKGVFRGPVWAVLRLHRPALRTWLGLVVVVSAALLWAHGPGFEHALAESRYGCLAQMDACDVATGPWGSQYYSVVVALSTLTVSYLPLLVAAWAGATLTGRELENGTAQLAWTQSITPARWLTAKLAVPALLVATGTALLVALHRWMWNDGRELLWGSWYDMDTFRANGLVTPAYALCGLALGALAGLLTRRTLPALAASFGALLVVYVLGNVDRASLWPTETLTGRHALDPPESVQVVESGVITVDGTSVGGNTTCTQFGDAARLRHCMADKGIADFWTTYHPASHVWPLQLVESGIVLAVAALAVAGSYALLRRRTA